MQQIDSSNLVVESTSPTERQLVLSMLESANLPTGDLDFEQVISFVGKVNDVVVAHAALEVYDDNGLIRSVVVVEAQRGRGFGKLLASAIDDIASKNSIQNLYLLTETAEKFFATQGYVAVDRSSAPTAIRESTEFCHVCSETAALMRKRTGRNIEE